MKRNPAELLEQSGFAVQRVPFLRTGAEIHSWLACSEKLMGFCVLFGKLPNRDAWWVEFLYRLSPIAWELSSIILHRADVPLWDCFSEPGQGSGWVLVRIVSLLS